MSQPPPAIGDEASRAVGHWGVVRGRGKGLGRGLNPPQKIFKTISNWTFLVHFEVLKTVYELLFVHKITYS